MKSIIIIILLFPLLLFGQDMAMENDCSEDKFSMNSFTFTNQDGDAYVNNSSQTSSSPSTIMMDNLDQIVVEFHPSAGIVGDAVGQGISNGLFMLACFDGMNSAITLGSGMPISSADISVTDMLLTRYMDGHSAKFKSLMILETVIPFIEVNYLKDYPSAGGFKIYQIMRFEDCVINHYGGGGQSSGALLTENITIAYTRACYRSFELDDNGAVVSQEDGCFDKTLSDQSSCACDPF